MSIIGLSSLSWGNKKKVAKNFDYKITKLRLSPKDIVLIKINVMLDRETIDQFKDHVQKQFPDNQVVILASGADLSILKKVKR